VNDCFVIFHYFSRINVVGRTSGAASPRRLRAAAWLGIGYHL